MDDTVAHYHDFLAKEPCHVICSTILLNLIKEQQINLFLLGS